MKTSFGWRSPGKGDLTIKTSSGERGSGCLPAGSGNLHNLLTRLGPRRLEQARLALGYLEMCLPALPPGLESASARPG